MSSFSDIFHKSSSKHTVIYTLEWAMKSKILDFANLSNRTLAEVYANLIDVYFDNNRSPSRRFNRSTQIYNEPALDQHKSFWTIFQQICIENVRRRMEASSDYINSERGGFVYLMGNAEFSFKIGFAKNPIKRPKGITKGASPIFVLHIIATDDMRTLESELHKKHAKKRRRGEWFAINESDARDIIKMKTKMYKGKNLVHLYSCKEIVTLANTISDTIDWGEYKAGFEAGSNDAVNRMQVGYSCSLLTSNYCAGYLTAYTTILELEDPPQIFNWEEETYCDDMDENDEDEEYYD